MVQKHHIAAAKILYQISEYLAIYFTGENNKRNERFHVITMTITPYIASTYTVTKTLTP